MRKLFGAIQNGLLEIRHNLMRSSLSLLGIILGVLNLTTMFSIVEGAKVATESYINSVAEPDVISVHLDWSKWREVSDQTDMRMDFRDYEVLVKHLTTDKGVGIEVYLHENMTYGDNYLRYTTIGITPSTFDMRKYDIQSGRRFTELDLESVNRVCIVGTTIQEQMFDGEDPLGEVVKIRDDYFTIIGVLEEFGAYSGYPGSSDENPFSWKNRRVLIPVTTAYQRFLGWGNESDWFMLYVQAQDMNNISGTMDEIRNVLMKIHNDQDIFEIEAVLDWQEEMDEFTGIWQVVLTIVAGISLLVGGIGIANVMLASFHERVREIGIRKSIGASNLDIFLLFIVETIVISLIGGVIGLGLGYLVSISALNEMLRSAMESTAQFSWSAGMVSIIFSMAVGLMAGLYPAIKAAQLAPVDALRYE